MNKAISDIKEFYPTPKELLDKILSNVEWHFIHTVLDPSAGKGDIVDYISDAAKNEWCERYKFRYDRTLDIDCIEIDPDLQKILKGKGYRVVNDNFLTFFTFKKYDLIIMNPPFSVGDQHLLKALDMQKNGGNIICILNAETIHNPYSNTRKELLRRLDECDAQIEFIKDAFVNSERSTEVEIAVIRIAIPEKEYESDLYKELKQKIYYESSDDAIDYAELAVNDFVQAVVKHYEMEVELGIKLMKEYMAIKPYLMDDLNQKNERYKHPILELTLENNGSVTSGMLNQYIKLVRKKYWTYLFEHPKFTSNMTSNLREQYRAQVEKLSEYDFSYFNIKTIQIEMNKNLIKGIEDCIIELFDKLSIQYSYSDELSNNIHYFNGWKTNKCWIINKKVILPFMNAWGWFGYDPTEYQIVEKLRDIEYALNYLDGGLTNDIDLYWTLQKAKEEKKSKKIILKYFNVTFYKKGTCHIEFTNLELLKKLNIFGSQQKGWLPPAYGKRSYADMDDESKRVIDEFEGEKSYKDTLNNAEYFIYDPKNSLPKLEMVS